ncbi:hypothetical protein PC120_g11382 [Phytophthora cactorum]|nr:hypothetical protein PC120_g11382 [Phytophthora cactorum]
MWVHNKHDFGLSLAQLFGEGFNRYDLGVAMSAIMTMLPVKIEYFATLSLSSMATV